MIDRYTRPEMGSLWTLQNRLDVWLKVELAICEAWNSLGVIPHDDMVIIRKNARFDLERVLEIEKTTRHDIIAFLTAVEENIGASSRFVHLGCTSSDIVDTANALLLTQAGKIILNELDKLLFTLKATAMANKGRLCMGRTHGVHAEPTSFGLKIAGFYAEFSRHRHRFYSAIEEINVGKMSGAVGTYTMLTPEVEKIACDILQLKVDPISTQIVQRDRYATYFTTLAIMAGGIERLCIELRHLQRTEVLEVEEGFGSGQKGSSAMPHKKNPISAENLSGLSRLIRTYSLAAMENTALWHERDISHSSVERVIMPDATILMDYCLNRLTTLMSELQINSATMEQNLMASFGLFFSQRVLLALIEKAGLPRKKAYEIVQKLAMTSWENKTSFPSLVRNDKVIQSYLSEDFLTKLFTIKTYLQYEDVIFNRVFNEPKDFCNE